jgi:diguanylate cyclase (GGDEF)-like protein
LSKATTGTVSCLANVRDVPEMERELSELRQEVRALRLANAELERLVVRDTLTPLFNRRHFMTSLTERIKRLERYGIGSALVFIDINGMKSINDRFGHSAGDFALVHIARLLESSIRATDIAARVGGDEFALLLDGISQTQAQEKADHLNSAIESSNCSFGGTRIDLSAAFGCTILRQGDSDFAAIARADMAMYAAKRAEDERSRHG